MQTIYPKKAVPFNAVSHRGLCLNRDASGGGTNSSPGPGQYKVSSDFDLNSYRKAMDDKGTYLTLDNGHLNQKR